METWMWALIIGGGLVLLLLLVMLAVRLRHRAQAKARTAELRARFGGEYDRTVKAKGRSSGEDELERRAERIEAVTDQSLSHDDRVLLRVRWREIQLAFVDDPAMAVRRADGLVTDALRRRGMPADDLDDRVTAAALERPELGDRYRRAHGVYVAIEGQQNGDTTDGAYRQAFLDYRDLFTAFCGDGVEEDGEAPLRGFSVTGVARS
jgi:hypothetical protein